MSFRQHSTKSGVCAADDRTASSSYIPCEGRERSQMEKATFGAGCFWGVESFFRQVPGVTEAVCGYAGGAGANPTYRQVCSDSTGHAEVVEVTFDPSKVSYGKLVDVFFMNHDPTQLNRQGPDVGTQYRSVIFTHGREQERVAQEKKAQLAESQKFRRPVVTSIEPAPPFWRAEEYHQRYFEKNGLPSCHVNFAAEKG
jgi:peptide-methionine (S)-S-oxide reductase